MGIALAWPLREPGNPYRWILSLDRDQAAPTCITHREKTSGLGICYSCVSDWRVTLGADPDEWTDCRVCLYPLHPAAEVGGFDVCVTCSGLPYSDGNTPE